MKRPIAELLTMTLNAGAESARTQHEQAAWQILRRKQGYVTHRIYSQIDNPLHRLVYSEWESKKAVDGARQYLQGTPLMRRARTLLAAAPQRTVVELVGHVTSTKGLDLAPGAVAVLATGRSQPNAEQWPQRVEELQRLFSTQPGHITHVLFRGLDADATVVGFMAHWIDEATFQEVRGSVEAAVASTLLAEGFTSVVYTPVD